MSQQDQHLTTEQLSTFLDQQLAPEEQALCRAHLQDCEQCRDALDNLQQTVNLLRSLPQLEVPRSFALPADFKITQITSMRDTQQQVEQSMVRRERSLHKLPTPLRRTLRVISALAAVIGLFFALSGLIAPLQSGVSTSLTPAPGITSSSAGSKAAPPASSHTTDNRPNGNSAPIGAPTVQNVNTPQPQSQSTQQNSPPETNSTATGQQQPFLDFNQPEVRLSIGLLLAILGGMGFALFAQRRIQRGRPVRKHSS